MLANKNNLYVQKQKTCLGKIKRKEFLRKRGRKSEKYTNIKNIYKIYCIIQKYTIAKYKNIMKSITIDIFQQFNIKLILYNNKINIINIYKHFNYSLNLTLSI